MFSSNATLNDSHQTQIVWFCVLQKLMLWHFYNHDTYSGYYEIQGEIVVSCGNQKIIKHVHLVFSIKTFGSSLPNNIMIALKLV